MASEKFEADFLLTPDFSSFHVFTVQGPGVVFLFDHDFLKILVEDPKCFVLHRFLLFPLVDNIYICLKNIPSWTKFLFLLYT